MAFELTDDGTLDTVVKCAECGEEMRYNYSSNWPDPGEDVAPDFSTAYQHFVEWALEDAAEQHECEPDEPNEPEEDDITTTDHETFYQNGRKVLERAGSLRGDCTAEWFYYTAKTSGTLGLWGDNHIGALRAYMERTQFWPNCWFISDHGNAHLIDVMEGK